MATNYDDYSDYGRVGSGSSIASTLINRVYLWMTMALLITAGAAFFTISSPTMLGIVYGSKYAMWVLLGIELIIVFAMSGLVNRMSTSAMMLLFVIFSALNGVTCSSIFLAFTKGSIVTTFVITSVTFAAMSIYGYFTKEDLTKVGNILLMALFGVIIASVVNWFLHSTTLYWIVSIVGVLIFVGLIAFDTQKIRQLSEIDNGENTGKLALMGALTLYLDFINLFLYLLRIFGSRNN
jgi:hypothetical protein